MVSVLYDGKMVQDPYSVVDQILVCRCVGVCQGGVGGGVNSLHYAIVGEGAGSFSSQIFILFLKFIF